MITARIKPDRPTPVEIRRFECVECGEHYDMVDIRPDDRLEHQCARPSHGAWWIMRRRAA